MKVWCYIAEISLNKKTTWLNQCLRHLILVEEFWDIGFQVIGKTLGLNTQDAVAIK